MPKMKTKSGAAKRFKIRAGGSINATGINLSVLVSSGKARAVLEVGNLVAGRGGKRVDLGSVDADVTIEEGRILVRRLANGKTVVLPVEGL